VPARIAFTVKGTSTFTFVHPSHYFNMSDKHPLANITKEKPRDKETEEK
jgi:hypothetical protein